MQQYSSRCSFSACVGEIVVGDELWFILKVLLDGVCSCHKKMKLELVMVFKKFEPREKGMLISKKKK